MTIKHIQPDNMFVAEGYSLGVISQGPLVHVAGQGAYNEDFQLVGPGDYFAQVMQAFENVTRVLTAAGTTPDKVVSFNCYIVGLTAEITEIFVSAMNQAVDGQPFPPNASVLIGVQALAYPEMLVEISAVAALE